MSRSCLKGCLLLQSQARQSPKICILLQDLSEVLPLVLREHHKGIIQIAIILCLQPMQFLKKIQNEFSDKRPGDDRLTTPSWEEAI